MLEKYKVDVDISNFKNYYDTPFHYVKEKGNRILSNCGLKYEDGAVLVDMSAGKEGWTREKIDLLHDFCVFAFDDIFEFEKKMVATLTLEMNQFGIPIPKPEQIYLVCQYGKNCYAVELNSKLIFT